MSMFGAALRGLGDVAAIPIDALFGRNAAPWQWGQSGQPMAIPQMPQTDPTAAQQPAQGTVMGSDGQPITVPQMQLASDPGMGGGPSGAPAPPAAPGQVSPFLGFLDNVLFQGAGQKVAQDNYARRMGAYQAQRLMDYGASLPDSEKAAFFADPSGYVKNQEEIAKAQGSGVKLSDNSLVYGDPAHGGIIVQGGSSGIDAPTHRPYVWQPNVTDLGTGQTSGGGFNAASPIGGGHPTANDGVLMDDTGVVGTYSKANSSPLPGQTINVQPTVTWTPFGRGAGVPPIAQQGGGQSAGTPAAPTSGLDANGDAVPTIPADQADQLAPIAPVSFKAPVTGPVSSGFGPRARPMAGASANHKGMDYAVPTGTPVAAAADGTVLHAGPIDGFGNAVVIRHADGTSSLYGHLSGVGVQAGQQVHQGDNIGASGATGTATGPNLHFAIYDAQHNPVNPQTVLKTGAMPGARPVAPISRPIPQADGTQAAGPVTIPGSVTSTGGPTGAQRYQVVDGAQVPGGKPGQSYVVDSLGVEKPTLQAGGYSMDTVQGTRKAFYESEPYKMATQNVAPVKALFDTVSNVAPGGVISMAAVDTLNKGLNPTGAVRPQTVQLFLEHLGVPEELKSHVLSVTGNGFLSPAILQQIGRTTWTYARSHVQQAQDQADRDTKLALAHGFKPEDVGETAPAMPAVPAWAQDQIPAAPAQRQVGRVYWGANGPGMWTGKGWRPQ